MASTPMPFTPIASTPLKFASSLSALGWDWGGAQADMQTSLFFHFTPNTNSATIRRTSENNFKPPRDHLAFCTVISSPTLKQGLRIDTMEGLRDGHLVAWVAAAT